VAGRRPFWLYHAISLHTMLCFCNVVMGKYPSEIASAKRWQKPPKTKEKNNNRKLNPTQLDTGNYPEGIALDGLRTITVYAIMHQLCLLSCRESGGRMDILFCLLRFP
jgi:hypothetical protein